MLGAWYVDTSVIYALGVVGAGVYLFTLLLNRGDMTLLTNQFIGLRGMTILFIAIGGAVTLAYVSSLAISVIPTNMLQILLVGFGWQSLLVSYPSSKKAAQKQKAGDVARYYSSESTNNEQRLKEFIVLAQFYRKRYEECKQELDNRF